MAVSALAKPVLVLVTYSVPICSRVPTQSFKDPSILSEIISPNLDESQESIFWCKKKKRISAVRQKTGIPAYEMIAPCSRCTMSFSFTLLGLKMHTDTGVKYKLWLLAHRSFLLLKYCISHGI